MKKAEIISLKRNEIKYVVKSNKKIDYFKFAIIGLVFASIFMIGSINFKGLSNPVNSLYNDNSGIVFTDGEILSEKLNFTIPIVSSLIEVLPDGTINFIAKNSIMIKSIESGYVDNVGVSNDGIKYIKILHNDEYYSIISNVDIVGVTKGDLVSKGRDVATSKVGDIVSLRIYKGGIQVSNLSVIGSKIICQN